MSRNLTDSEIEYKLKPVENRIKQKGSKKFYREDIQNAINLIIWNVPSLEELERQLKNLISGRAGIRDIGYKTFYTPRGDLVEEDKTFHFVRDIYSFRGVKERFGNGKDGKREESGALR